MDNLFIAAVEEIYQAAVDSSRWPLALQATADVFGDVGAVMLWQRDDGGFGVIASVGLADAQRDYQENGWHMRDTRSIRAIERALWLKTDAMTERHFTTDAEMAADPFYVQFLARYGLRWCAAIGVSPDPTISAAISIQRAADRPPYSDLELDIATRLGRHTEKALRLSIRLLDSELTKLGLQDALSRIGVGVFSLDSLGRVIFSNPRGQSLLGDGLSIVDERLRVRQSTSKAEIEAAIALMTQGDRSEIAADPKPLMIQRVRSNRPLVLYVLPIVRALPQVDGFLAQAKAIVLVIDPKSDDPPDPALIRDVLGITLGEARVAALIGSGLAPRAAAEKLGITEETTRTVLKRVFSKVGISRQSELVALLTKSVLR
jgi:DNA-binding CsgD family transcriptional regulator